MNNAYPQLIQDVLTAYKDLLSLGLPIALVIGACNLACNTIITAFFTGKLRFGGRHHD